jgi:hypothetical protein
MGKRNVAKRRGRVRHWRPESDRYGDCGGFPAARPASSTDCKITLSRLSTTSAPNARHVTHSRSRRRIAAICTFLLCADRGRLAARIRHLIDFANVLDAFGRFRTSIWCPGKDSNLHGLHRWYLKPVRLPIPPPGHGRFLKRLGGRMSTPRRGRWPWAMTIAPARR